MSGYPRRLRNRLLAICLALTVAGHPVWSAEDAGKATVGPEASSGTQVEGLPGTAPVKDAEAHRSAEAAPQAGQPSPAQAPAQPAPAAVSATPQAPPLEQPPAKPPEPAKPVPASSPKPAGQPAASKPIVLYGRIEEIAAGTGARLPVKLKALTPKLDTSKQLKGGAQSSMGRVVGSFPVDWRGVWTGTLKIHAAVFDPVRWQFDAEEANRERELLRPGTEGRVSFRFSTLRSRQIRLEPASVVFAAPIDRTRYAEMVNQLQTLFLGGQSGQGAIMLRGLPYLYALHLGDLENGVGVTGNILQSRVIRNDITELAPGVLEQVVVTYNLVRNPTTGKSRYGYSENVVRFTRQTSNKLYVQAATVSYLSNGKFEDKTILYGMVARGQGTGSGHPLDGLMPGFSFPQ